ARPLPAEQALGPYGQVGSLVLATAQALGGGQERLPSAGGVSMLRRLAGGLAPPRREGPAPRPPPTGPVGAHALPPPPPRLLRPQPVPAGAVPGGGGRLAARRGRTPRGGAAGTVAARRVRRDGTGARAGRRRIGGLGRLGGRRRQRHRGTARQRFPGRGG